MKLEIWIKYNFLKQFLSSYPSKVKAEPTWLAKAG